MDALQDQEVKDFRSKMKRLSEEKMQQMQMMSWGEWLRSSYSPQLDTGSLDNLIDRHEGIIKITMHYDQSQVCVLFSIWPIAYVSTMKLNINSLIGFLSVGHSQPESIIALYSI